MLNDVIRACIIVVLSFLFYTDSYSLSMSQEYKITYKSRIVYSRLSYIANCTHNDVIKISGNKIYRGYDNTHCVKNKKIIGSNDIDNDPSYGVIYPLNGSKNIKEVCTQKRGSKYMKCSTGRITDSGFVQDTDYKISSNYQLSSRISGRNLTLKTVTSGSAETVTFNLDNCSNITRKYSAPGSGLSAVGRPTCKKIR